MLFQVIRMPIRSTLLSIGRQGLFFIPALFILPHFMGLQGVMVTQPVADVATFLFSLPFIHWIVGRLKAHAAEG
jgi:Na+-driven multidrug efflux pump